MQLALDGRPIDELAIETIREYVRKGKQVNVAYSGGKDSEVILDLVKRANVEFTAHYNWVPIDPPELRRHIKERMRDPANRLTIDFPEWSFLSAATKHGIMPRRNARWCCELFKEGASEDLTITGIRRTESVRRSKRRTFESCRRRGTWLLHPIISWTTNDVWQYIHERRLPVCSLYHEGWKRIGCVLCPMVRDVQRQMARWPGITRVWKRINDEVFKQAKNSPFRSAEAQWEWWLDRDAKATDSDDCPLFDGTME
jgi:phosphoadenosine phosphosulfate reductase